MNKSNSIASSYSASKKFFKLSPVYLAIFTTAFPIQSLSAIIPGEGAGDLNVNQSANGTPTINIVDPNSNGISHNKYQEFNVDKNGVIFNNSKNDGVSQTGGFVIKNNNLNNEANVIINEVGGVKGTQLNGTMEVFGKSADLIIANENGIEVNGAKTLNANNLTLSTGKVELSDGQYLLNVNKGQVNITGNGISTDGLSNFEIISRAIKLDGQIAGSADVKLLAGSNKYNTSKGTYVKTGASGENKPIVAIDGSELGSIYGNRVELISTETGLGVHHKGSIVSQSSLDITADGDLKLTALQSKNSSVKLNGENITISKNKAGLGGISAKNNVDIHSKKTLTLAADLVSEEGKIDIAADRFLQQSAGIFVKNSKYPTEIDSIIINVKGEYILEGQLYATNSKGEVIPNAKINLQDGNYVVYDGNGTIVKDAMISSTSTTMADSGNINVKAGSLTNNNGVFIGRSGSLVFDITDIFNNDGVLSASGNLHITSKTLKNTSMLTSQNSVTLELNNLFNSGVIVAEEVNVNSLEMKNDGEIVAKNGWLNLKVSKEIDNSGLLQGQNVNINTKDGRLINKGTIASGNNLNINSKEIDNSNKINAKNELNITSTGNINNFKGSEIISGNKLTLQGAGENSINNQGRLQGEDIDILNFNTLENSGAIISNEKLVIDETNSIKNKGSDAVIQGNSILISNANDLVNEQGSKINSKDKLKINKVSELTNSGAIYAENQLSLTDIREINNQDGSIVSGGNLEINKVSKLINSSANSKDGGIYSNQNLVLTNVDVVENKLGAKIVSENGNVYLEDINAISNLAGSLIAASNNIIFNNIKNIANSGEISAENNIKFSNVDTLKNNGGVILAGNDLILSNISDLLNIHEGHIKAGNIKADDILYLKNEDSFIDSDGNIYLNVKRIDNISTNNNFRVDAYISAQNSMHIVAEDVNNKTALIDAINELEINAANSISNTEGSEIYADNNVVIKTNNLHNNKSNIKSEGNTHVEIYQNITNNDGYIIATNDLYFKINNDFIYDKDSGYFQVNDANGSMKLESEGSITVNKVLESSAAIQLYATGSITNTSGILSGNNVHLEANGDITNEKNALIFSSKEVNIITENGTFSNNEKANVSAISDINITAENVINKGGKIRSEKNINIESKYLKNETTIYNKDGEWDYSNSQQINGQHTQPSCGWGGFATCSYYISGSIPNPVGIIEIDDQATISAKNELNINKQNKYEGGQKTENKGGTIQSGGNMFIRGDLTNEALSISIGYDSILDKQLSDPLVAKYHWSAIGSNTETQEFSTLHEFIDFILSPESDENYLKATKKVGDETIFSAHMSQLFGASWKAKNKEDLQNDWQKLNQRDPVTGKPEYSNLKFYAVSEQKSVIAAGGNLQHVDGSFNNGLDKELAVDKQSNEHVVIEKVGDQEINVNNSSYDVTTSKKDISRLENQSGITTSNTYEEMAKMPGLFDKNNDIVGGYANLQPSPDPSENIHVLYETRPEFINQDAFYGSDYFFQQVGYEPTEPVIVLGDNYFISEVIRREIDDSVGAFFLTRDGVEGADLTKQLMDNAGTVNGADEFVIGEPLTPEQINNLDKDIVWFVTEDVEGVQVLVPRIYLAPSTLEEIKNDSSNASAIVSAGGDVQIDATEVNNVNGSIKSGGNVDIKSENNIVNSSVGQNGGIVAGGNISLVSETGDIHNSGAALKAGENIKVEAKEGDVTLTASTGYNDQGKKVTHRYDDAVTAGGNIDISGNNVTVNAVDIEADKDISLTAKDGDVKFNNLYDVDSSYDSEYTSSGLLTSTLKETTTSEAKSVESTVKAGGNLTINASNDIVMKGGEYSGESGNINAGGNIDVQATQDYSYSEQVDSSSGFVLGAKVSGFGKSAEYDSYSAEGTNTTAENGTHNNKESQVSNAGSKRPGSAPTTETGGFQAGFKTETTTTTENSVTNNNASLNFGNDLTIKAGDTVDIGGGDFESDSIKIEANELKSTKYEDTTSKTVTHEETFIGVKAEAHSDVIDAYDKIGNKIEQDKSGKEINAGLTTAEVAGEVTNVIFGDIAGTSVSVGKDKTSDTTQSTTSKENITTIKGNNIEINTKSDAELNGVNITGNNVDMDIGGELTVNSAKTEYTESSSSNSLSVGLSAGASVGLTGGGVGVSIDASEQKSSSKESGTSYTNSNITGDNVTIKTGGDLSLTGANINSNTADIDVGGDLNITSVQDTVNRNDSSEQWGASIGLAVSTSGVIPTASGSYGQGSEEYQSKTTSEQSGIKTTGELNIKTGNDVNLTGGHIVSQSGEGSVDVGGDINATTLTDTIKQDGLTAGGGAGVSMKGMPTANGYVNTSDTIDYEEDQKATISVGQPNLDKINGDLNTDKDNMSEVTKDVVIAGNDISFTVGSIGSGKDKKPSDSSTTPNKKPTTPDKKPTTPEKKPTTPDKKPTTPEKKPTTPEKKPTTPEKKPTAPEKKPTTPETKPTIPEKKPTTPEKKPTTPEKKPTTPETKPTTPEKKPTTPEKKPTTPEKKPTTPETKPTTPETKPTTPETKPVTKWPEVQPTKPVVTSPGGSSSMPGFVPPKGNGSQSGNGQNEAPKANGLQGQG
ncbi:hemagglutinin repeat-containing protein, partial [Providencia huaxiensis]